MGSNDVRAAYTQFMGREPTQFEIIYYTQKAGKEGAAGAAELYRDIIAGGPRDGNFAFYDASGPKPYTGTITPASPTTQTAPPLAARTRASCSSRIRCSRSRPV